MIKNIVYIFVFIFFTSCLSEKIGLVGNYDSDDLINHDSSKYVSNILDIVDNLKEEKLTYAEKVEIEKNKNSEAKLTLDFSESENKEIKNKTFENKEIRIVYIKNTKTIKQSSDLYDGRIIYKIPDIMKVRSTYKVLVRISKSKSIITMTDNLTGDVMTSEIPVTETMEVKLIDVSPTDRKMFEIISDNNNVVQFIEKDESYTEWSWDVTPVNIGNSKLKIVVSVIRNGNRKDVVYEDTVDVEMDVFVQIKFFIVKYWQWLLTSMIIPFGIFLYKSKESKK